MVRGGGDLEDMDLTGGDLLRRATSMEKIHNVYISVSRSQSAYHPKLDNSPATRNHSARFKYTKDSDNKLSRNMRVFTIVLVKCRICLVDRVLWGGASHSG